ncbi:hypothetical protein D9615_007723 [Tricholomella constricta]|uniref:DUF5648 domain-containing protein n=1 Tax=Tricholomella constricta TaxID=117010 RepID=A0A8H5H3J4_9AGAR|nr:hypothetical protein D9615_007723 [Tricholomella constricta]
MKFTFSLTAALFSIAQVSAMALAEHNMLEARAPGQTCGDPKTALPLLRAWNGGIVDHFYTTNAAEMQRAVSSLGYVAEGTTGYVFSKQQTGTVPFFRLYHPGVRNHFYTTNAAERDNAVNRLGYASEGVVGYVYPNTACGGLPLYRSYHGGGQDHFYTMSAAERDSAKGGGWAYEGIAAYTFPY